MIRLSAVIAGALLCAVVQADEVSDLVMLLDDPSYAVREAASDELARNSAFTLSDLAPYLRDESISLEQRTRLLDAGRARFFSSPRPAMGVTLGPLVPGEGKIVQDTIAGFDSAKVLKPGDIVTVIGGVRIRSDEDLRSAIICRDANEEIEVELIRANERMVVPLRLGRWGSLPQSGPLPRRSLESAWRLRLELMGVAERRPARIRLSLGEDAWSRDRDDIARKLSQGGGAPGLVAGGEAQGGGARAALQEQERLSGTQQEQRAQLVASLSNRLLRLNQDISQLRNAIRANEANIKSGRFKGDRAQLARDAIARDEQILAKMESDRDRLEMNIEVIRRGGE